MAPGIPMFVSSWQSAESCTRQLGVADIMPPVYCPSRTDCRSPGARRYVVAFDCGDFASHLTHLDFDGNEERMALIEENKAPHRSDIHILDYNVTESAVYNSQFARGEGIARSLLVTPLLVPFPDGWNDCNEWVARNVSQFQLDGLMALLRMRP